MKKNLVLRKLFLAKWMICEENYVDSHSELILTRVFKSDWQTVNESCICVNEQAGQQ